MLQAAKDTGMGSQFCNTQRATFKQELPPGHVILMGSHGPAQGTRVRSRSRGSSRAKTKPRPFTCLVNTGPFPNPRPGAGMCHRGLPGVGALEPEQRGQ